MRDDPGKTHYAATFGLTFFGMIYGANGGRQVGSKVVG